MRDGIRIPIVRERVRVRRRREVRRWRVRTRVDRWEEDVEVPYTEGDVEVRRVPVGRVVTGEAPAPRQEGDTLIVPVLTERVHVERELVLEAEIRVTRRRRQLRHRERVPLRAQRVEVDPPAEGEPS